MSRTAASFTQTDIARLVAGAIKGGWPVEKMRLVVEDRQVMLLPFDGEGDASPAGDEANPLDKELGLA